MSGDSEGWAEVFRSNASVALEPCEREAGIWLAAEDPLARAEREAGWHWAWVDPAEASSGDPHGRPFTWTFTLPRPLSEARLRVAAQKGLPGVWLDGRLLHSTQGANAGREFQDLDLGPQPLAAGTHRVAVLVRTFHPFVDDPKQGGLSARLRGSFGDGAPVFLVPRADDWFTRPAVPASAGACPDAWQTTEPMHTAGWRRAAAPASPIDWQPAPPQPARCMRRAFELTVTPERAVLSITALGGYEAAINGRRVGDALLTPENSDFRVRVLKQQFDVTALLHPGENVLGVTVGDGFYASEAIGRGRYPFGSAPRRLHAQLLLRWPGGRVSAVATDDRWRSASAAVTFSEIYHGEHHDARLEQPGWDAPGFDDSDWDAVWPAPMPTCRVDPQYSPPIRATLQRSPQTITLLADGDWVVDFGQNFAGWCRIVVRGEAGRTVTLRFAEILAGDGKVDMRNLRSARCTDRYTLRGSPDGETWEPRFTYHGFRYVQVSGWPGELRAGDIVGLAVHSDLPVTGDFHCSQPVVHGLWRNTLWSQRSNFVGIPTDCPQRDERLGWTGDAQVFWPTAAFNMDVRGFTRRFLADMRASQRADGAYADTNPPALPAFGAHGWSDAGVVLPHAVWSHYGETDIVEEHWASMERWMAWIAEANPDGLWTQRRDVDFGDWLAPDAVNPMQETTPKLLSATACWARMLGLMGEMARATGRTDRAASYDAARNRVGAAFARRFVQSDGVVGNGSHSSYILALAFGLVPIALRQAAADALAAAIRSRGNLLSTGFLGTPFSLDVLADHGHEDLAVRLLLRTEYPSWGYMIAQGATTLWERWNGDTGDVAMNSYNHYAFGAITAFIYRRVAGIAPAAPGFAALRCAPLLDPRLGEGRCRLVTVRGAVTTTWGVTPRGEPWFELHAPAGMPVTVCLPGQPPLDCQGGTPRRWVQAAPPGCADSRQPGCTGGG